MILQERNNASQKRPIHPSNEQLLGPRSHHQVGTNWQECVKPGGYPVTGRYMILILNVNMPLGFTGPINFL